MSSYTSTLMPRAALSPAERLERIGGSLLRWSLIFLLVFFGALKWTAAEAEGVRPLIVHSQALWWLDRAFGPQGASEFIGVIELITALLIALRRWAPRLTMVGGLMGMVMFVTTLSFIVTTPDVGPSLPFLLKDVTLLGASTWIAGEAWVAVTRKKP